MQILMPRSVRAVARHRGKAEPKADLESKFLITSGGSRMSWAATVSKRVRKDHRFRRSVTDLSEADRMKETRN